MGKFMELDGLGQALLFHSRQRRKSLAGVVQLRRDSQIFGATMDAAIPQALLSDSLASPITFQTAIRITGANPTGIVFHYGTSAGSITLWLNGSEINFRAGDTTPQVITFDNTVDLPVDLEMDLVASVIPGERRMRVWGNGTELVRKAPGATMPNIAVAADGDFARAVSGTAPGDVTQTGAPTNFDVIEPLSVYKRQFPQHMV